MNELRAPPAATMRAASGLALALLGLVLLPLIAAEGTVLVLQRIDRRCPTPAVLRGSIAPERTLVRLEMLEDRP